MVKEIGVGIGVAGAVSESQYQSAAGAGLVAESGVGIPCRVPLVPPQALGEQRQGV